MRPKIKICGLMREEDVKMCCRQGVDICGFVTDYPIPVPWNLTKKQCAQLMQHVSAPVKSCVVTGGEKGRIIHLARTLRPDYIQLHYKEKIEDVALVVQAVKPFGVKVIKTIPNSEKERMEQFGCMDQQVCVSKLCSAGVEIILVDSRGPSNAAHRRTAKTASEQGLDQRLNRDLGQRADQGFGQMTDQMMAFKNNLSWYLKVKTDTDLPVMLGGGITADNCREVIQKIQPDILDIMTGVETAPGVKAEELVSRLIHNCV